MTVWAKGPTIRKKIYNFIYCFDNVNFLSYKSELTFKTKKICHFVCIEICIIYVLD